jgi:hypothetical protein
MGCGCKQPVKQEKIVPKGIQPIQVQAVEDTTVNYRIEDVIRIKDYLSSTNKHDLEKQFIKELLYENFGDIIPDYCDQNCLKQISMRVQQMESKLSN